MEVRNWMKSNVHTVKPLDSVLHARELMATHRVNQLVVVVDGRLVGIVTDRDLRDAFPSAFDAPVLGRRKAKPSGTDPRELTVEMTMTPQVITIGPAAPMREAAALMRRHRIGALPVVDGGKLVGIVTRSDVLECFVAGK